MIKEVFHASGFIVCSQTDGIDKPEELAYELASGFIIMEKIINEIKKTLKEWKLCIKQQYPNKRIHYNYYWSLDICNLEQSS